MNLQEYKQKLDKHLDLGEISKEHYDRLVEGLDILDEKNL